MRIVSLIPSATEIVALLGGSDDLVGRSHECDFPDAVLHAPALTAARTRIDPGSGRDSAAIDREVREALSAGDSLYTLDVDRLVALAPDAILTQDLCSVCSIDPGSVRRAARVIGERTGREPRVVALNPRSVEGMLDDVLTVGQAIGRESEATLALSALRERLWRAVEHVNVYEAGPSLAFLEWTDPLFVGGHWTVQLIERAGARHPLNPTRADERAGSGAGMQVAARTAGHSFAVSPEVLLESRPEAMVIAPCGLTLEQSRSAAEALAAEPWFDRLPCARSGRIAIVDGNQMFNRPGPRLIDAQEWLVGWIHGLPRLMPPGFPWEPLR
ncbi:MAG: ABC transporter substrate-binding protein [Phycisphaeraceae bacterium]|nr:ABC transporter substrate-binding protein [Phycisphaeraceae bacterium]